MYDFQHKQQQQQQGFTGWLQQQQQGFNTDFQQQQQPDGLTLKQNADLIPNQEQQQLDWMVCEVLKIHAISQTIIKNRGALSEKDIANKKLFYENLKNINKQCFDNANKIIIEKCKTEPELMRAQMESIQEQQEQQSQISIDENFPFEISNS